VLPEPPAHRAARAVAVAVAGLPGTARIDLSAGPTPRAGPPGQVLLAEVSGDAFWCGVGVQRLIAALWAEDLTGTLTPARDPGRYVVEIEAASG
jgi:hypothetical protein